MWEPAYWKRGLRGFSPLFLKEAELGIFLVCYFARNFYLNEQIFDHIDNWDNDD